MIDCVFPLAILSIALAALQIHWYLEKQATSGGIIPYAPIVIRDLQRGDRRDDD